MAMNEDPYGNQKIVMPNHAASRSNVNWRTEQAVASRDLKVMDSNV